MTVRSGAGGKGRQLLLYFEERHSGICKEPENERVVHRCTDGSRGIEKRQKTGIIAKLIQTARIISVFRVYQKIQTRKQVAKKYVLFPRLCLRLDELPAGNETQRNRWLDHIVTSLESISDSLVRGV